MALLEGEREKLLVTEGANPVERAELLRVVIDRIIDGVKEEKNQVMTDHEAAVVLQGELPELAVDAICNILNGRIDHASEQEVPTDFHYLKFDVFLPKELKETVREGIRIREVLPTETVYEGLFARLPDMIKSAAKGDEGKYVLLMTEESTPKVEVMERAMFERLRTDLQPDLAVTPMIKPVENLPSATSKPPKAPPSSIDVQRAISLRKMAIEAGVLVTLQNAMVCKFDISLPKKVKKLFRKDSQRSQTLICFSVTIHPKDANNKFGGDELNNLSQRHYRAVYFPEGGIWTVIQKRYLDGIYEYFLL